MLKMRKCHRENGYWKCKTCFKKMPFLDEAKEHQREAGADVRWLCTIHKKYEDKIGD